MKKLLIAAAIAMPLTLSLGAVAPMDGPHVASAKITQTCTNGGGQEVQGQCNDNTPHTKQKVNPQGFPPPGQNPDS